MVAHTLDLTGYTNGRLKVLYMLPKDRTNPSGCRLYQCLCYCGNLVVYDTNQIRHSKYPRVSCGTCYLDKRFKKEYHTYENIMDRCYNTNRARYKDYGGRGVIVAERWKKDFLFFLEDMGLCPSPWHTIERIDVNGNYEPGNCKWLIDTLQALNKRNSK